MYLSWIIPAYREEKRIRKTVQEVDAYLRSKRFPGGYEIIVVDSTSPDRTAAIVRELEATIPHLSLKSVENRGKGWAVRAGMLAATGEIRLFSDADNSTAPAYFDDMVPFFEQGYDVVISSRDAKDAKGASRDVKEPWYREALGALGNLMIQAVAGTWGMWDTQNGFKAMTARAAESIFPRMVMHGFSFDIELLTLARQSGLRIGIIPIRWRFDPDSKVTLKAYLQVFADVFRIRWNLLTGRYRTP
ncbi:MAG: glycosyltransferase [bacterium]|nr:glycosyltransferase [bacterium]